MFKNGLNNSRVSFTIDEKNSKAKNILTELLQRISDLEADAEKRAVQKLKYNYVEKYPDLINCRNKLLSKWELSNRSISIDYSKPAPASTHELRIIRG